MKIVSGRLWLVCLCVGLLAMSGVAVAQEYAIKAVKVVKSGGAEIPYDPPVSSVTVAAGDQIECEISAWEWSPDDQRLRAFQFTLDGSAIGTDDAPILPAYWDNPEPGHVCDYDTDCDPGQICWIPEDSTQGGICAGPDHDPERGAFMDSTREDYIFNVGIQPVPEMQGLDLSRLNFRYSSAFTGSPSIMPMYSEPHKYCGTLTYDVLPNACGTFTLTGYLMPNSLFLGSDNIIIPIVAVHGLEINAGDCQCEEPVLEYPPVDCAIDARQPDDPGGGAPAGWDSMTIRFDDAPPCDPCDLGPGDFSVREDPFGIPPIIAGRTCDADSITLQLGRRIKRQKWTCIKYNYTGDEFCMGHQPGDVTGDRTSAPIDILRVIDCLNEVATCAIYQCDVDRSAVCAPPDILRVIDLLNGAGVYDPWLNERIDPCPTAPPP